MEPLAEGAGVVAGHRGQVGALLGAAVGDRRAQALLPGHVGGDSRPDGVDVHPDAEVGDLVLLPGGGRAETVQPRARPAEGGVRRVRRPPSAPPAQRCPARRRGPPPRRRPGLQPGRSRRSRRSAPGWPRRRSAPGWPRWRPSRPARCPGPCWRSTRRCPPGPRHLSTSSHVVASVPSVTADPAGIDPLDRHPAGNVIGNRDRPPSRAGGPEANQGTYRVICDK